ncbi:MAG: dicarboxylate/amino acid:cation symporter [Gammaproteobacteria bacterium]|nr:MAG: dicarboxylate/amino acid:cation symporter [Gammaproteobacteria bacterium]
MRRFPLYGKILIALFAAFLTGAVLTPDSQIFGLSVLSCLSFLGSLFLNALKMLIVPLIMASIISGVSDINEKGVFGRLGIKTLGYYLLTSMLAILTGLVLVNLVSPGVVNGQPARSLIGLSEDTSAVMDKVSGHGAGDIAEIFLRMVPPNIIEAAANGQMLGLIFFSLIFGYFVTTLDRGHGQQTMREFWRATFNVMMKMTDWILGFAPIGVYALVAKVAITVGLAAFQPLLAFFVTVLLALAVHLGLTLPVLLKLVGGISPSRHFKAMMPALLMAFSTSSSSATLPVTLECIEKKVGVSNRTSSFVLPLGATVNMDGTALYECVAAMFIAQAYGLELSLVTQFTVVLVALLTSIGVAGIPSASLVAITVILAAIGLPAEGIGLILAVDRILDMCRTGVNVFSDSCGAAIIASREGEQLFSESDHTRSDSEL